MNGQLEFAADVAVCRLVTGGQAYGRRLAWASEGGLVFGEM